MPTETPLEMTPAEAEALARENPRTVQIIDVREPDEVAICKVDRARFIPMREIPASLASLPRDQHLLILCHHGSRSLRVTQFLRQQGYSRVTNVAGGIEAWAVEVDPSLARY